ncbi:MAG: translation initiation factor IF-2 [Candidatus Omnitrophica bacterium]|nr:translation initiation factor IF-2 [Candidatus Omnitrophota bacterium]
MAAPVPPAPVVSAPVAKQPAVQVAPPPPPVPPPAPPLKVLSVPVPLTVKELAEKLSLSPGELIKHLMGMKMMMTINQLLTEEPVEKLLKIYGYQYQRLLTMEEQVVAGEAEDPSKLVPRSPVVTLMGHVDHGKTSLLDAIRQTRVVEGEAGGITQHIGAYRVMLPKGTITFLDTPGHEAFTAMRARGANVTDIVVLVVAADDGVMPQTIEAIDHAKAAEATIVVAMNKIDKASANPDKVKKQLLELGLMSEDWGGKTIIVPVSAKTGDGIDQLLDYLLLEAELMELKADPSRSARGVVLEGKLTKGGGPVGHLLIQSGTLRVGEMLLTGTAWGRVRALLDARGHRLEEAGPSTPVEVLGLNGVPEAGDPVLVVTDERRAREIALRREEELKQTKMSAARRFVTLEEFHQLQQAGRVKELNLIVKADVQGSLEALRESLSKIPAEKASLKFLHVGVGAVAESDILLAEASNAVVIGFHVDTTPEAEALAKEAQVDVRRYEIIYQAVNDIRAALEGLLEPKLVEQVLGRAKVLQPFKITKVGTIAGCQVLKGKITRGSVGRLFRGSQKLFQGKIDSLKRFKDDVREVTEGMQCGVGLAGYTDFQADDIIESIEIQQVAQKLS